MQKNRVCSECGAMLPQEVIETPCPTCAFRGALALSADNLSQVGNYQLLRKIGEGGCGIVYLAEQTRPICRQVALKIVKLGMDTRQVVARFEMERHTLARMDHPNIARVLDAGASENGRPFFVMELVSGVRITDFCDQKNLSIRERLALFVRVCHGVQHAHQKGILHRDLKPSNILVATIDGVSVPKVIDFGIAKAMQQPVSDETSLTHGHQPLGTPAYMSPEQAGVGLTDVDTRSDIYSLGVLLYELLTGRVPFDPVESTRIGLNQMLRTLRETEPLSPSLKLVALPISVGTGIAQKRRIDREGLAKALRGDLDAIVLKCLEKDPARRYTSANDLAADLERHMNDQVISATAPGVVYRAGKFVRRNRWELAVGSALATLLLAGTVASTSQALRAMRAEREERRLRADAETRQQLVEQAFAEAQAQKERAERSLIQMERQKTEKELALKDAELQRTHALAALRETQLAEERALAALESARNANHRAEGALYQAQEQQARLESVMNFMLYDLSAKLQPLGKVDLLRSVTEKVLAHYQEDAGSAQGESSLARRYAALRNLASVLAAQGNSVEAMKTYNACEAIAGNLASESRHSEAWQAEWCACRCEIGRLIARQGEFVRAVQEFGSGRELMDALAAQDPCKLEWLALRQSCDAGLADALWALGEKADAIATARNALKTSRFLAEQDPGKLAWKLDLCAACNRLGAFLLQESDLSAGRKVCQEGLDLARKLAAENAGDPTVLIQLALSLENVGDAQLADKQTDMALLHYNDALKLRQQLVRTDPDNAEWQRDLLRSYFRVGRAMLDENKKSRLLGLFQDSLKAMGNVHKKHLQFAQELFLAGRPNAKSLEALQENLNLARQLADKDLANMECQDNLARNYSLAGDVSCEAGDRTRALDQYEKALQIRLELCRRGGPRALSLQVDLAVAYARLAAALEQQGSQERAAGEARAALGTLVPLTARWPGNFALLEVPGFDGKQPGVFGALTSAQRGAFAAAFKRGFEAVQRQSAGVAGTSGAVEDWADSCAQRAIFDLLQGDFKSAAAHAGKSVSIRRRLCRENPADPELKTRFSESVLALSVVQLLDHQVPAAMRTAQEGIDLQPNNPGPKGIVVLCHLLRGELDEAEFILEPMKDLPVGPRKKFGEAVFAEFGHLREKGYGTANVRRGMVTQILAAGSR